MKKRVMALVFLLCLCMFLPGCIHWETPVGYALMYDISEIKSIRIYGTEDGSEVLYDYSDTDDPCRVLLGEIPGDQYAAFTEQLTGLSFTESHMILLFPAAVDPNFYYGRYIVKIEYQDGSCELISDIIQRQFGADEKLADTTRYATEHEPGLAFLQNWADISASN